MSALAEHPIATRGLSEEERRQKRQMLRLLEQDRVRLLVHQPFIAALAMRMDLKPVIDVRMTTAATDGRDLYFSVPFMRSLSLQERLFIMAHEVWHCAALHFARRGTREAERWNVAIDHEVNHILVEQGMTMPEGGILFPQLAGANAEKVYELLPEHLPDRGPGADLHDPGALPVHADGEEDAGPEAQSGPPSRPSEMPGRDGVPIDPDYAPSVDDRIWRDWPRRVHAAAQQVYRQPGSQPDWLKELLAIHGRPSLPWQELLRRFVERVRSDRYRWAPPNRRHVGQGLILPGRGGERLRLAVAIDTSGSTLADRSAFLTELRGILASHGRFEVRVIGCDVRVHYDQTFSDERPLPREVDLGGGGGTELMPVFELLAADPPPAMVFLTDGFADISDKPARWPVLWCLTADGQEPCGWGEMLRLPAA